ncbi:hypothetical protein CEXT_355861 [Caerostris extrusa]|uniref:Uncharacterized protein n=1 Tax=Caerostris extrusa TaxID=172846 RepID=A0AAV4PT58_CAEEX|nr:hypothetical protein CEXT_355861 [Caerostris extrusa]
MEDIRPAYMRKGSPQKGKLHFVLFSFKSYLLAERRTGLEDFFYKYSKNFILERRAANFRLPRLISIWPNGASPQHTKDSTLGLKKILKGEFYFQNKLNRVSDLEAFHLASRILADKSNHND